MVTFTLSLTWLRQASRKSLVSNWCYGVSGSFPRSETVQHMEQEKGYSYQVYQGLQSIPECTLRTCGNRTAFVW